MSELNFPNTDEPVTTAIQETVNYVLERYDNVIGIIVAGSILRGEGDKNSDVDTFIIIEGDYRQRVQKFFNGVRFELFVNAVDFVPLYFEEEAKDGGPSTAHMLTTGHIILNRNPTIIGECITQARAMLEEGPQYNANALVNERYMLADRIENAMDLRERDPLMGLILIDSTLSGMLVYQFKKQDIWVPRHKDLLATLRNSEPKLTQLVEKYYEASVEDKFEIAGLIADYTLEARGFFEWESDEDRLD